jgi:hypothetical protein
MLNEEVYIEIHWANNPIPIDEIVDSSDLIFEIPFGVFTPYPVSPVNSVNGKIGDIQLTAADINADESGTAQNLFEALDDQKLNKIDYVQHFRGLYDSFADLIAAIPVGTDGDYAQIKESQNFGRLEAIWSGSILGWSITGANASSTTDTVAEGNNNLYFKAERVLQTPMTGLPVVAPSEVMPTDELLITVAKLQAQIKKLDPVWIKARTVGDVHPNINVENDFIELAKINGMLWIRGFFKNTSSLIYESQPYFFKILDPEFKVVQRIESTSTSYILKIIAISENKSTTIGLRCRGKSIDAASAAESLQYLNILFTTLLTATEFYFIPPTCLGELIYPD